MTPIALTFTDRIQLLRADEQMEAFRWTREKLSTAKGRPRSPKRRCAEPGCNDHAHSRDLCRVHYWQRHGKARRAAQYCAASPQG